MTNVNVTDATLLDEYPTHLKSGLAGSAPTWFGGIVEQIDRLTGESKGKYVHEIVGSMGYWKDANQARAYYSQNKAIINPYLNMVNYRKMLDDFYGPFQNSMMPYLIAGVMGVGVGVIGYMVYQKRNGGARSNPVYAPQSGQQYSEQEPWLR